MRLKPKPLKLAVAALFAGSLGAAAVSIAHAAAAPGPDQAGRAGQGVGERRPSTSSTCGPSAAP